ncbi:AAA family ATPase [Polyangium sorediatum]|uniref:AAA family ATPase n=1 Tax=Polyangium sorediatum TaxID=889274 RepID=A0ABT6P1D0_9BACT|nr:ATP-binding protein [Polyangium sorediatum]MDI1434378.1 AAA family ATPase [Polyangium sorediatum]
MHLLRLDIERIRAVEKLSLDFSTPLGGPRRRVVFLGANGAGKTTILASITYAFDALSEGGGVKFGARKFGAGDVRDTLVGSSALRSASASPRFGVIDLELSLSDDERATAKQAVPEAPPRGSLYFNVGREHATFDDLLAELSEKKGLTDPFFDVARTATLNARPPCVLLPADRGILEPADRTRIGDLFFFDPRQQCLSPHRRRFATLAARLAFAALDPKRYDPHGTIARMRKVLNKYFPELPRPEDPTNPASPYKTQRGSLVQLESLSDGERALLLLLGEIALRPPHGGIVLIDEPEQHLHPRWQRTLLEALASLVPTAQLVLATQSPYLAACAPDDVIEIGDWKRDGQ